jgi:hypothetical protein
LATDKHWDVRSAISSRPDLSTALIEQLATDKFWAVRRAIAGAYRP